MVKDAFGHDLELGDMVIYSTKGGGGTEYIIGEIAKMLPCDDDDDSFYVAPDRVSIDVRHHTTSIGFSRNPILYASNVVRIRSLPLG
jgi:hypothetical protein